MADIFNMLDTWNASGTVFTGIKLNVTDSASAAGSLLMDLQVGGVSKANITKAGRFYSDIATNSAAAVSYALKTGVTTGFGGYFDSPALISSGDARLWANNTGVYVGTNIKLWLPTSTFISFNDDLILYRDAANTLAQRNGGNPQAFNLYNTYTDASNYERGFMRWSSNILQIGSDKLGSGFLARDLAFQTDGVTRLTIGSTGLMTSTQRLLLNVSAPIALGTPILRIGGATYGTNGFYGLGFGYASGTNNMPIEIGMDETSSTGETFGDFYVATRSVTTNTAPSIRLRVTSTGKLELSDTIKTAAPTGGTSAEWRLGTVASVTPTSPNRTIEVDIGGTIYYLHAKTTND